MLLIRVVLADPLQCAFRTAPKQLLFSAQSVGVNWLEDGVNRVGVSE